MPTNSTALTRLLLSERKPLLRVLQGIVGSAATAEDVAQSVWLRIQRLEDAPPIHNKRAYLFRLASNLAIDRVRAERHYRDLFETAETLPDIPAPLVAADRSIVGRETLALVMEAIDELPPQVRDIFIMRKIDELPIEEICRRVGISRSMVSRHLQRALRHCAGKFQPAD